MFLISRMPRLILMCAVLALASCSRFFPSDPAGGLAARLTADGSAAVELPNCPDRPLDVQSITISALDGDVIGEQLWKITAAEPQPIASEYILGVVPPGFVATGKWNKSFMDNPLSIRAVVSGGIELLSHATYRRFDVGTLYIGDEAGDQELLREQIGCG